MESYLNDVFQFCNAEQYADETPDGLLFHLPSQFVHDILKLDGIQTGTKINKNVQMNISKILSLCEKWRFGDLYYLIKDVKLSSETTLLNLEINYNNNIYIFDFKNIITYIQDKLYNNISIKQLCLNDCEYTNTNNKYLIIFI